MQWKVRIYYETVYEDLDHGGYRSEIREDEISVNLPTAGLSEARSMVLQLARSGFWIDTVFVPGHRVYSVQLEEEAIPKVD